MMLAVTLLAACGGSKVQVAEGAVRQLSSIVGSRGLTTVELTADDVSRLARQAGVADDVIRDTAPQLDNQSVWSRSMINLKGVYDDTPGEIRSNLVGLACDGVRGKITNEAQLEGSLVDRFSGYRRDQLVQLRDAVVELWQDLYDAQTSSNPDLKATAVLTCFTVEQAVG